MTRYSKFQEQVGDFADSTMGVVLSTSALGGIEAPNVNNTYKKNRQSCYQTGSMSNQYHYWGFYILVQQYSRVKQSFRKRGTESKKETKRAQTGC